MNIIFPTTYKDYKDRLISVLVHYVDIVDCKSETYDEYNLVADWMEKYLYAMITVIHGIDNNILNEREDIVKLLEQCALEFPTFPSFELRKIWEAKYINNLRELHPKNVTENHQKENKD